MSRRRSTYLLLAVLFFLVLGAGVVVSYLLFDVGRPAVDVPARAVLDIGLNGPVSEIAPPDFWTTLFMNVRPVAVHDVWLGLLKAKSDPRIRAVLLRPGLLECSWGKVAEIRDAVLDFRTSGKKVYAYFEEAPDADKEYYLATACDRIVLHPLGWLGINGIGGYQPFFKGTLDKLGIKAEFEHIEEYKTAYNLFTEPGFTPAHREETESYLGDVFDLYVTTAAAARRKTPEEFKALLDQAFFQGENARTAGLVDDVLYDDELRDKLLSEGGRPLRKIGLEAYAKVRSPAAGLGGGRRLALIYGVGPILSGESVPQVMGGATVARWLRQAREDKSIAAVVFRVDSPGGSSVASDVIGREVALTKRAKPIVVSMSDVAGSGGYWVAMHAHKIVAQPQTLTGSIGVLAGKFSFRDLYDKLGISAEDVSFGAKADIFSTYRPFTPEERQALRKEILYTYDKFIAGVAEGRRLTPEKVNEIGRGRIWTGRQAKERGLVDEIGGLSTAIRLAKKLAGIPSEEQISLSIWPKKRSFWDSVFGRRAPETGFGAQAELQKALEIFRLMAEPRVWALMPQALTAR
jgi:protease-4